MSVMDHQSPPSKVSQHHLDRWALVYVRQSTAQQLLLNQESTRLQYALRARAVALGWEEARVEVIADDLGRSGANVEGRPGFQRLVAEVGLDHVGLILGLDRSRFARSCRDWHQLLEVCALFNTLIADLDGIYDPSNYNDRLLLGLKGTISEAELHLIRRRMQGGRLSKAQRGELALALPLGYLRRPSGEVIKEPDEQARFVVEMVFEEFARCGAAHGVLRYLKKHGLRLPVREWAGPQKGELTWRKPALMTLMGILKHPMYAGAYVFGRHSMDKRRQTPGKPGTGRRLVAREEWQVFLPDRLPAYITWEQYLTNQEQLRANCPQNQGTPRQGPSLLAGLIVCGRCGRRMRAMSGRSRITYLCAQAHANWAEPICQSLSGKVLDNEIERQVLAVLEPASLDLSMRVAAEVEARRMQEEAIWAQRLERAKFEAERSQRQYNAVEPENHLVVRTLERDWEEKLQVLRKLEDDYRRHQAQSPPLLSKAEREAIATLAKDIPGLWHSPAATWEQRKEIVRQLIDQVQVTVLGESERVLVAIFWAGGFETKLEIQRPVRTAQQLTYLGSLKERICALQDEGRTSTEIACRLTEEHWHTPRLCECFSAAAVRQLQHRWKRVQPKSPVRQEPMPKQKGRPK